MSWWDKAYVREEVLLAKLHSYPNLLLWIAGHRHYNTGTAFPSPDKTRPGLGFWQVETASLRDFPQQFRTVDIVRNSDGTVSIVTVNAGPSLRMTPRPQSPVPMPLPALQLIINPTISTNPMLYLPTGSILRGVGRAVEPANAGKIASVWDAAAVSDGHGGKG
ncbi:hypothetical protein [Solidesulfovibrio sp.]